jgi:hypothetical protein
MEQQEWIPADTICTFYQVDVSLIQTIGDYGLINLNSEDNHLWVPVSGLGELERILRLHTELDINMEGIEAISHMLQRMKELQQEVGLLRTKLSVYEHHVE